jgi:hypothetical protein
VTTNTATYAKQQIPVNHRVTLWTKDVASSARRAGNPSIQRSRVGLVGETLSGSRETYRNDFRQAWRRAVGSRQLWASMLPVWEE